MQNYNEHHILESRLLLFLSQVTCDAFVQTEFYPFKLCIISKIPFSLNDQNTLFTPRPKRKIQEGGILDCLGKHEIPVNCLSHVWYREDTFFF